MPEEAKAYTEQVEQALMAGDTDQAEHQARMFQDRVGGAHRRRCWRAPTTRSAAA